MPTKEEQVLAIQNLSARMEKRLQVQFLIGIEKVKNSLDLNTIQGFLEAGHVSMAIDMVNTTLIQDGFTGFSTTLVDSFVAGGQLAASFVPPLTSATTGIAVNVAFDQVNPAVVQIMQAYQMNKIREITADVRVTIQAALQNAMEHGLGPAQAARDFRDSIGLTANQEKAVQTYRAALENRSQNALQRELRDRRFDPSISRAIREQKNLSKEQIDKMVSRYRDKYLKYRSETIARTESIRTLNVTGKQVWNDLVADGKLEEDRVRRFWVSTHDGRTRHAHVQIPIMNKEGVGLDDPFESPLGPILYPGDPRALAANVINCRCAVFTRIVDNDN